MMEKRTMICEGSLCPPNRFGRCTMCFADAGVDEDGEVRPHDRLDILRMLDEGAFDA